MLLFVSESPPLFHISDPFLTSLSHFLFLSGSTFPWVSDWDCKWILKLCPADWLCCAVRGVGKGELPIQVTAINAHPAWCASLCPSRWIQPYPSTPTLLSLSLSRPLHPPPATHVETAPAADAFTSFGGFYPEQRQSGQISLAPIKPTFLCQLSPLSLWHVWGGKLLDEI